MMAIIFIIILALLMTVLVGCVAVRPRRTTMSHFELKRRQASGDKTALRELARDGIVDDFEAATRVCAALILCIMTLVAVAGFGWGIGSIVALLIALLHGTVSRIRPIHAAFQKLYERHEDRVLSAVSRIEPFVSVVRTGRRRAPVFQIDSREELRHLVQRSSGIVSDEQKKLITHGLGFTERVVREIMTGRDMIEAVPRGELLGPLTLSELHQTGHGRFPVYHETLDRIVGVLHIQDQLVASSGKSSTTAEMAMTQPLFVAETDSLEEAMRALLASGQHLAIVTADDNTTVGLVTMSDLVEALLGRRLR